MGSEVSPPSTNTTQEAQRLLKEARIVANPPTKLLHRVRSKLQFSKSDLTFSTLVDYLDNSDVRSLDAVETLLQTLKSQSSVDKFQSVCRRLFVIAAKHGHTEILKHLFVACGAVDLRQVDSLIQDAIFFRHKSSVELLLQVPHTADAVQYALLTTDYMALDKAREITPLLLNSGLPRSVLDYLILKMYASPAEDFHCEVLEMLVTEAARRNSDGDAETAYKSFGLARYFELQKQVKTASVHYPISPHSLEKSAAMDQLNVVHRPIRNVFGDDIITSPRNLVLKLLERHLQDCSTREGFKNQWPLAKIDLLLDWMPLGAEELTEYSRCILLAAKFQQTIVFTRLLHYRVLSVRSLRSLSGLTVVINFEIVTTLLDFLNRGQLSDQVYAEIINDLLSHACKAKLLPQAVQICSRSRIPVPISFVWTHVIAMTCDASTQDVWISDLFKTTEVRQPDLDMLWKYVLSAEKFPTNTARALLRAGYNSEDVASLFLRSVRTGEEISNLSMIIDEWKIPRRGELRDSFHYRTGNPAKDDKHTAMKSQQQFFSTLATALEIGIECQRLDLCQLLLANGAPLVSAQKSLLEKAVLCGPKHSTLAQDKILDLVLRAEITRTDCQSVLDFALLQAVKSYRYQTVAELIDQGASTIAHGYGCWHLMFLSKSEVPLQYILATTRGGAELSRNFVAIFTSFSSDPEAWIPLLSRLHKAGFADRSCYMEVWQILIQHNKLTNQSMEELIKYSGFGQQARDQFLETCWLYGNLSAIQVLIRKGISQTAAETLFRLVLSGCIASTTVMCSANGHALKRPAAEMVYGIMTLLLRIEMPMYILKVALSSIALLRDEPAVLRVPILITLLEKGARFSEDDDFALLHCLFVDDHILAQHVDASQPPMKARQAALQTCFQFPSGRGAPALPHRLRALTRLLYPPASTPLITLTERDVMSATVMFLSPDSHTPVDLIHLFYHWLQNKTSIRIRNAKDVTMVEKELDCIVRDLVGPKDVNSHLVDRALAVLHQVSPAAESNILSDSKYFSHRIFRISQASLSRYLIATSKAGLIDVVEVLLKIGTNPNVLENGKSALFWAATRNKPDTAKVLISAGAGLNDGSLHEATCRQHLAVMQVLLDARRAQACISDLHHNRTPLLAFVHFDHAMSDINKFPKTINILMKSTQITSKTCSEVELAVEAALSNPHAFRLILALLPWLRTCFCFDPLALQAPLSAGPLRYSLLSLINMWEHRYLSPAQSNSLVLQLQQMGFEEMLYTTEGDQPTNAVNVPKAIIAAQEARKRLSAFVTKECCICTERPDNENDIHAGLAPSCAKSHGWKDDYICSDCLRRYLESRMFPHDNEAIRYKFPSTRIPCWSPRCATTELSHSSLKQYADPQIFRTYDFALCQAALREGKSVVNCSRPGCPGAQWYDNNKELDAVKIFFCNICRQNTCMECNDLYEKHDNRPCPASEEARKSERIKQEEKLSKQALRLEKRCPKCRLMYQKYAGCDHIVCGKDSRVDSKLHLSSFSGFPFVSTYTDKSCRRMSLRILRQVFWSLAWRPYQKV